MSDEKTSEAFETWASEEGINNFHFNHCWAAWQAALVSAGKPAVPEGWKLVPNKITPRMVAAYHNYWRTTQNIYGLWVALLDASPAIPSEEPAAFTVPERQAGETFGEWARRTYESQSPTAPAQSEAVALEACRAIVKWCDDNPPAGDALWCVQLARRAIGAQPERVLTFAPLYKKLMHGDVDICEAYLRLKVVGSCPTQEEFCAALEALLANGADHD